MTKLLLGPEEEKRQCLLEVTLDWEAEILRDNQNCNFLNIIPVSIRNNKFKSKSRA